MNDRTTLNPHEKTTRPCRVAWCDRPHTGRFHVHMCNVGTAPLNDEGAQVLVSLASDIDDESNRCVLVVPLGAGARTEKHPGVWLPAGEAPGFAGLADLMGRGELAAVVRQAVALIESEGAR